MLDLISVQQIKNFFTDQNIFDAGQLLHSQGRILEIDSSHRSDEALEIRAKIKGDRKKTHHCRCLITKNNKAKATLTAKCTCHKGVNCKHIAASLIGYTSGYETTEQNGSFNLLMETLASELKKNQIEKIDRNYHPSERRRLLYILDTHNGQLILKTHLATKSSNGYQQELPYSIPEVKQKRYPAYVIGADLEIFALLRFSKKIVGNDKSNNLLISNTLKSRQALQTILKTGRCHWQNIHSKALTLGDKRQSIPTWSINNNGEYILRLQSADTITKYLPTTPIMYLDLDNFVCGELVHRFTHDCANLISFSAAKQYDAAVRFQQKISEISDSQIPLPKQLPIDNRGVIQPTPIITLKSIDASDNNFYYNSVRNQPVKKINGITVSFNYLNKIIHNDNQDKNQVICANDADKLIRFERDITAEHKLIDKIASFGLTCLNQSERYEPILESDNEVFIYDGGHEIEFWMELTAELFPELEKNGWDIKNDSSFRLIKTETSNWYVKIGGSNNKNEKVSLDIGVSSDNEEYNLLPILNAKKDILNKQYLRKNKTTILDLDGGKKLPVESKDLMNIFDILAELNDKTFLNKNGTISLSKFNLATISELEDFAETTSAKWQADIYSKGIINQIGEFNGIKKIQKPSGLQATLRPYQQDGLNWLQFLRQHSFGGILADDMGLGKTLQTLAHILLEKEQGRLTKPALIVAPTSLIFNWRQELERFTPSLSLLILHGTDRKEQHKQIENYDVVLTTYPLIHRDKDIFLLSSFYILILDESQAIKNPRTQTARAINLIDATHKICLTGTPVENHLGELWSQTNLIAPGLLGNMKQFRTIFQDPIENGAIQERKEQLQKRIKPFVMRRTKSEVESDLPPKTIIIRSLELSDSQKKLYESIRASTIVSLKALRNADNINNKNYPVILNALLKLRQVCCHPKLTKLDTVHKNARSNKLDLLLDLLPKMIEDKRKILIFSQFSSMLKIIAKELEAAEINHSILTGETKDREAAVNTFQNGDASVFLISLKAGGSGLNLTAADTVIHYDPWWNPAAEDQATDRAYRIGQDKPVFIYKLISTGTVEEKILELQQEKTKIAKDIYSSSGYQLHKEDLEELLAPLT